MGTAPRLSSRRPASSRTPGSPSVSATSVQMLIGLSPLGGLLCPEPLTPPPSSEQPHPFLTCPCPDHCPLPWQRKLFLCPYLQAPHMLKCCVEPDAHKTRNDGSTQWKRTRRRLRFLPHLGHHLPEARPPPRSCLSSAPLCGLRGRCRPASPAKPWWVTPSSGSPAPGTPQPAAFPDPFTRAKFR